MNFIKKTSIWLNIIAVLALLISYTATYISPETLIIPSLFGLAYPIILIVNIIFITIWLLAKSRLTLLSTIAIVIGISNYNNVVQMSISESDISSDKSIKIVSYNISHFEHLGINNIKSTREDIIDYLKDRDADIITLQEARIYKNGEYSARSIMKSLPKMKSHQLAHATKLSGSITLSAYPIIKLGEIRFKGSSNIVIYSDIKLPNRDTIRVYNCHLQSYKIKPEQYEIDPLTSDDHDRLSEIEEVGTKISIAMKIRAAQADSIRRHIDSSPYPTIVSGDFNDTPVSYSYTTVREDLKDAFQERGVGLSATYNGTIPSLRIDHILFNSRWDCGSYNIEKPNLSDHFPIEAVIYKRE